MSEDHIEHVVLLMLENRSFDQVLGCFQSKYPDLDGVDPTRFNVDSAGSKYYQNSGATKQTDPDPRHELEHVQTQLKDNNSGFVQDYEKYAGADSEQRQQVMSFYDRDVGKDLLPALHKLANDFTICDRWFSSLPGPTWPNRFFALSGTCSGKVDMPDGISHPDLAGFFNQTQDTIFDRLDAAKKRYTIYYYDFPCSLVLAHQRQRRQLDHYRNIDFFFNQDVSDESTFPDFVFIEPKYSGVDQNDDHPPHNVVKGEKLIADVYNAIRSNDALWSSTLLIVAFDEHGGFYDHVEPPPAVPPRPFQPGDQYTFDRYGVRVPALLISPWVEARVEHTLFDHTSVLKYVVEKWGLKGDLGARTAGANSIGVALRDSFRQDTVQFIRVPYTDLVPDRPDLEAKDISNHQEALRALSFFLTKESDVVQTKALNVLASDAGAVERAKASLGAQLIRIGTWLTRGVEQHAKEQAKFMRQAIENLLNHRE
jgi:phospholipase C